MEPAERRVAAVAGAAVAFRPLRVVVCPDKFRGSLCAPEVAAALASGLRSVLNVQVLSAPIADGGEGTVDCCVAAGFVKHLARVSGPDGALVDARFAVRAGTAVIEAAQACGLGRERPSPASARMAGSYGVGELIDAALGLGSRTVIVGVGGTASSDGGAGMLQALGARLEDDCGRAISTGGAGLGALAAVDLTAARDRLAGRELIVATDVGNPLLGRGGAAVVFGPQKGADAATVATLEQGIRRWSELCNPALATVTGAGAGGGLAYGLLSVGARRVSGADAILDLLEIDRLARDAELLVTGEGSLDSTSLAGKAPIAVARRGRALGVPVVAVAGRSTLSEAEARAAGFDAIDELVALAGSDERSMRDAAGLLSVVGRRIGRRWSVPVAGPAPAGWPV
jgi:glycerate kinase